MCEIRGYTGFYRLELPKLGISRHVTGCHPLVVHVYKWGTNKLTVKIGRKYFGYYIVRRLISVMSS